MTKATHPLIPFQEAPSYPTLDTARGYAETLRISPPGAYKKGERWALYRQSSRLDILAIELCPDTYAVVALPPDSSGMAREGFLDLLEYFQGWLFRYDRHHARWSLEARSEEEGTSEFIRLWRELQAG
jgi:hypothetical protein